MVFGMVYYYRFGWSPWVNEDVHWDPDANIALIYMWNMGTILCPHVVNYQGSEIAGGHEDLCTVNWIIVHISRSCQFFSETESVEITA